MTQYTYGTDSICTSCGGAGQIATLSKPDGTTIAYSYDLAGRVTEVNYSAISGGPELTYDYDLASRVTSVTDTRLPFTNKTYTYDRDIGVTGFLTKITHPEGYTQEFYYNADKLEAYRDVDGSLIEYTYDAMGRISALADQFGGTTSWTYATTSDTPCQRHQAGDLRQRRDAELCLRQHGAHDGASVQEERRHDEHRKPRLHVH